MSDDFSSSTRIGGVYVEITAPVQRLRADVASAKAVAQQAERELRITIPLRLEASGIRAELPRLLSAAQASVRPIIVPVVFKAIGGPGGGGGGGFIGGGGGGLPMLPGPSGGSGGGSMVGGGGGAIAGGGYYSVSSGTGGGGWQGGYSGSYATASSYGLLGRSGGGGGGGGSGSGGGIGIRGLVGAHILIRGIGMAGQIAENFDTPELRGVSKFDLFNRMTNPMASGFGESEREREATLAMLNGMGPIGAFAGRLSGFSKAEGVELADRSARQQAQIQSTSRRLSIRSDLATAQGDTVGAARADMAVRLSEAHKLAVASGDMTLFPREQKLGEIAIADATRLRDAGYRRENEAYDVSTTRSRSLADYRRGDDEAYISGNRAADKLSLQSSLDARLDTVKDPTLRKHIAASNKAELSLFDEDTEKEKAERQKHRAADVATAIGSAQEATLRIAGNTYAADLKAFDTATKAKLSLINDLESRQNEAARLGAQRSVIVDQQNREVRAAIVGATGSAVASGFRANRQFRAADLAMYDANATNALAAAKGTPQFAAIQAAIVAGRGALIAGQAFEQGNIAASAQTRQAGAILMAGGRRQTAGAVASAAGAMRELAAAEPGDRPALQAALIEELEAEKLGILRERSSVSRAGVIRHASLQSFARLPGAAAEAVRAAEARAAKAPDALDVINNAQDAIRNSKGGGVNGKPAEDWLKQAVDLLGKILGKVGGARTS